MDINAYFVNMVWQMDIDSVVLTDTFNWFKYSETIICTHAYEPVHGWNMKRIQQLDVLIWVCLKIV
jgi:hypothetical protein